MALICSTRLPKYSVNLIFHRLLKCNSFLQKSSKFSTARLSLSNSAPIKYTTNKASKVQIVDTIGSPKAVSKNDEIDYRRHILVFSTLIFLTYFCIFREENDLDEILKGNPEFVNKAAELYDLKVKLIYCEQNNLPKDALKAKIAELEKDKRIPNPFPK